MALLLVDYPHKSRLKILGRAKAVEGTETREWIGRLGRPGHSASVERVVIVHVDTFDWSRIAVCFTIADMLPPMNPDDAAVD